MGRIRQAAVTASAASSAHRMPCPALSRGALITHGKPTASTATRTASSRARAGTISNLSWATPAPAHNSRWRALLFAARMAPTGLCGSPHALCHCRGQDEHRGARGDDHVNRVGAGHDPAGAVLRVTRDDGNDRATAQRKSGALAGHDEVQAHPGSYQQEVRCPVGTGRNQKQHAWRRSPAVVGAPVTVSRGEERVGSLFVVGDVDQSGHAQQPRAQQRLDGLPDRQFGQAAALAAPLEPDPDPPVRHADDSHVPSVGGDRRVDLDTEDPADRLGERSRCPAVVVWQARPTSYRG